MAQLTLERLTEDVAFFAEQQNSCTVPRLAWLTDEVMSSIVRAASGSSARTASSMSGKSAVGRVRRLRSTLLSLLRADLAAIGETAPDILRFADGADLPQRRALVREQSNSSMKGA